jgi:alkylation response protein AidB-like acyl-CoA dehydrogenase
MGKTGTIERFIWKSSGIWAFESLIQKLWWIKLRFVLHCYLFRGTSKIKSSGFAAAMWAHSYLAMTHLNAEGDERIKQDYLAPSIAGDLIGALCISEPLEVVM